MIITRKILYESGARHVCGSWVDWVHEAGVSPIQIYSMDIPDKDKLWVLLNRYGNEQPLTDAKYRLLARKWAKEKCAEMCAEMCFSEGKTSQEDLEIAMVEVWSAVESEAAGAAYAAWHVASTMHDCEKRRLLADVRDVIIGDLFPELEVIEHIKNNDKSTVICETSGVRRVFRCHAGTWHEEINGVSKGAANAATVEIIERAIAERSEVRS